MKFAFVKTKHMLNFMCRSILINFIKGNRTVLPSNFCFIPVLLA